MIGTAPVLRRCRARPALAEGALVVGVFTLLAIVATYPLARHISTDLVSDLGDPC